MVKRKKTEKNKDKETAKEIFALENLLVHSVNGQKVCKEKIIVTHCTKQNVKVEEETVCNEKQQTLNDKIR